MTVSLNKDGDVSHFTRSKISNAVLSQRSVFFKLGQYRSHNGDVARKLPESQMCCRVHTGCVTRKMKLCPIFRFSCCFCMLLEN